MKYTLINTLSKRKDSTPVSFVKGEDAIVRVSPHRVALEVGIGEREAMTHRKLITTVRKVITLAKSARTKVIAINFSDLMFPHLAIRGEELAELLVVNLEMANFEFVKYKTKPKEGWPALTEAVIVGKFDGALKRAFHKGKTIAEEVNATRVLANTPGGDMTPTKLADAAVTAAKGLPIDVTVLDEAAMGSLGMGAVLGVGKGSADKPRFIVMEYKGGLEGERPIVLVGKGVTFDTGGLNLKPSDAMYEMHMDMSGGAAVIHAIVLAARLKLKKNVVALIPAVENMPSGSSYHPGDVLRSMSGKTIEILNTDAEGRVILADALHYAKQYKPRLVVDVATLTGAAMVALGNKASAILTPEKELEERLRALGEETGDYVWPMPLWEEYEADIKGTFGDWANTGKSRMGGVMHGALFLWQFVKNHKGVAAYPWVHIDMAPRMTAGEGEYLAKGATGTPVRLLARLLETF